MYRCTTHERQLLLLLLLFSQPKGRVHKKKCGKSMVFYQTGGGSPRVIKNQTPFLEKYFFSELVESF